MYAFYDNVSVRLARTFLSTIKRLACWPLLQGDATFPPMPTLHTRSARPLGQLFCPLESPHPEISDLSELWLSQEP